MEKKRVVVYLNPEHIESLQKTGNISKYIRTLIETDLNAGSHIQQKLREAKQTEAELEMKLIETKNEIQFLESSLCAYKEIQNYRPPQYDDVVHWLEKVDHVTQDEFVAQARKLDVSVEQLKNWLFADGVYDSIFS